MRPIKILLLLLSVTFQGCKKDNGSKLPVIKGINKKDINAQPIGTEGEANINVGQSDGGFISTPELLAYPNPASDLLYVNIKGKGQARVWMVRGRYRPVKLGPNEVLGIAMNIPIDRVVDLKGGGAGVLLDLADVPNGYYRLYVEFDSYTLWDNVKVEK